MFMEYDREHFHRNNVKAKEGEEAESTKDCAQNEVGLSFELDEW